MSSFRGVDRGNPAHPYLQGQGDPVRRLLSLIWTLGVRTVVAAFSGSAQPSSKTMPSDFADVVSRTSLMRLFSEHGYWATCPFKASSQIVKPYGLKIHRILKPFTPHSKPFSQLETWEPTSNPKSKAPGRCLRRRSFVERSSARSPRHG